MTETNLQKELFNYIKNSLPNHILMADAIADLLDISYDSVYRRIRGEKPISLDELKLLCEHFHISLDQVLQLNNEKVVFNAPGINGETISFDDYLRGLVAQMKYINSFKERKMLYLSKDLPFWQFYLFPDIAAFKTFFWRKTIRNETEFSDRLFSLSEFPFEECFAIGQQINLEYNNIPSIELWNMESINSTLSQIKFYYEAGIFKSNSDFEQVVDSFEKVLIHMQLQAEKGVKFMPGATDVSYKSSWSYMLMK